MIYLATYSLLLFAGAALAQQLMPGTVASSAGPASFEEPSTAVPSPFTGSGSSSSSSSTGSSSSDALPPINAQQRIQWVVKSTIGPESLAAGLFSAGWDTGFNRPKTYGPHWEGYGDRYGMRLAGLAVSNTMEAGLGSLWGEDPRYTRDAGAPFKERVGHAVKMTFMAQNRDGSVKLAYARFLAIPGSNFLSNTWRAPGEDTANSALVGTGLGFLGRLGSNAFDEFWPDVERKLFHRGQGGN